MATFTRVTVKPIGQAYPIIFEVGETGEFQLNAQTTPLYLKNDEGIMVPFAMRTDQTQPTFNFTPIRDDALSSSLRFLRSLSSAAGSGVYAFIKQVTSGTYAAQTTGFQGFGALADDTNVVGYANDNGVLTALTRQPFATFAPGTANSFAVGANAALRFSDDLVAAKRSVGLTIPYPYTGAAVLGTPMPNFEATIIGVTNDNVDGLRRLFQINLSNATVDLSQSGTLTSGNSSQISIVDLSQRCSLDIRYLQEQPSC